MLLSVPRRVTMNLRRQGASQAPFFMEDYMKRFLICVALCLFVFGFVGTGYAAERATKFNALQIDRTKSDDYRGVDTFRVNDQAGTSIWRLDKTGNLSIIDSSGVTDTYIPRDRVVYITSYSQLSTWSGAAAGQSYFQCEPGKTYIVDPHAIVVSNNVAGGGAPGGTSAAMLAFSGVSAILPDSSVYDGPAYDVTTLLATTGASGYAVAMTGSTGIQVWPFQGNAGLTAYGKSPAFYATSYRSSNTPYTMATLYTTLGSVSTYRVAPGVSYWEVDRLGEQATFGLENSSVSAFVKSRNIFN